MIRAFLISVLAAGLMLAESAAGWKLGLEPKAKLKAQAPVPVQVTVNDAKGAPVAGAEVELVLTMVEMDHGETKVPAKQLKPGVYQAMPKFIMEGKWNIEVRARKGAQSSSMKKQVDVSDE